jgi:hypothetical protein
MFLLHFLVCFRLPIIIKPLQFEAARHPELHAVFDLSPSPFSTLVSSHQASRSCGTDRMSNGGQKRPIGLRRRDFSPPAMEAAV